MTANLRNPPAARLHSALPIILLSAVGAALLLRVVSTAQPLGIDQSLWASAARGLARGQLLYRDVWEQRPPGIFAVYVAAFQIFGWTAAAVAWLDILASTVTTVLLYAIARKLAGPLTGALAAALFAVLTMPAWLYRHGGFLERSVSETFIVVCIAAAACCAVMSRERSSLLTTAGAGFFAGMAVVFKPNAGLYLPALLMWMVCYRIELRAGAGWDGSIIGRILGAVLASAVVPLVACLWLWRLDLLGEARIAVVDFNRYYVTAGFTIGGYSLVFSKAVWLRMKTDPLWLAGGVGAVVACWELVRTRKLAPLGGLAVLWGGAAALVIVVNGVRLYNTYFIQALAPLALLVAWLLTVGWRGPFIRRLVVATTVGLMLLVMLQRHYPAKVLEWARADFDVLRGRLDRTTYLERFGGYANNRGYSARANDELATYLRTHTRVDERIFLFGINGAGVYFLSDRLAAHRFLRVNFFVPTEFPNPRFNLSAVVDELAVSRPRYIIFERLHSSSAMGKAADALPVHPKITHLLQAYRIEITIEDFSLYRRADREALPAP